MNTTGHLWLDAERFAELKRHQHTHHPHLSGILDVCAQLKRYSPKDVLGGKSVGHERFDTFEDILIATAVTALINADPRAAREAAEAWLEWSADARQIRSDLVLAHRILYGCVVCDCCVNHLDASTCRQLAERFLAIADLFWAPGPDNPHMVGNNWWGVTHSAALCAGIAASSLGMHNEEQLAWARGRVKVFLNHFGDGGLYHEGLGYECYTLSHLLPALLLLRRFHNDRTERYPQLRYAAHALLLASNPRQEVIDDATRLEGGAMLSWNDSGLGFPHSGMWGPLMELSPEEWRGSLALCFDRICGWLGCKDFGHQGAGCFFNLIYYPYRQRDEVNAVKLPLSARDRRQGYVLHRNRWLDANDAILGVYARTTHIGGHSQDDAGSIRLMDQQHDWIIGGGQARPEACWQSIVVPEDGSRAGKPHPCGHIIWDERRGDHACVGMDLR
ncbi:MAG: hypothetical protein D6820_08720, partial [Lentisphaerae bacterium]